MAVTMAKKKKTVISMYSYALIFFDLFKILLGSNSKSNYLLSKKNQNSKMLIFEPVASVFSRGHATLHLAVSVGRSVRPSVGRSHF